jgi:hypothetical protein
MYFCSDSLEIPHVFLLRLPCPYVNLSKKTSEQENIMYFCSDSLEVPYVFCSISPCKYAPLPLDLPRYFSSGVLAVGHAARVGLQDAVGADSATGALPLAQEGCATFRAGENPGLCDGCIAAESVANAPPSQCSLFSQPSRDHNSCVDPFSSTRRDKDNAGNVRSKHGEEENKPS